MSEMDEKLYEALDAAKDLYALLQECDLPTQATAAWDIIFDLTDIIEEGEDPYEGEILHEL